MTKSDKTSRKTSTSFESKMKELENIVEHISKNTLPLEESVKLFEKGITLSKSCSKELNQVRMKIQKIVNSNTKDPLEIEDLSSV